MIGLDSFFAGKNL